MLKRPGETLSSAAIRPPASDVTAFELHRAFVRKVEAGDDVDEGRLARPVRPDEPDHLVPVQLEGHVMERLNALEGTRDRGGPECFGPPRLLEAFSVWQSVGQIFGTTFAFTVPTTLGTLFCTRITRY